MRFSLVIPAAVLYAASVASATTCWAANSCIGSMWENKDAMQNFATQYCRANWHSDAAYLGYGVATASHQGKFPSKDNCDEVFSDIINMCLGISNGAYEGLGDARLVVSFGSCEVV